MKSRNTVVKLILLSFTLTILVACMDNSLSRSVKAANELNCTINEVTFTLVKEDLVQTYANGTSKLKLYRASGCGRTKFWTRVEYPNSSKPPEILEGCHWGSLVCNKDKTQPLDETLR
jgi:hypothetical protein